MTLRVLRNTFQKFCRMYLGWDLLMFSLKLAQDYRFGEEVHRSKLFFTSYHIRGPCCQNDISVGINIDHLTEVVFVRFLHCKVILFFFSPYTVLLEKNCCVQLILMGCELMFFFLQGVLSHKLFEILLHSRLFILPYFKKSKYLFISVWTLGYLFCTLDYNPIIQHFFTIFS